jgi:hypothetical protein
LLQYSDFGWALPVRDQQVSSSRDRSAEERASGDTANPKIAPTLSRPSVERDYCGAQA